MAVYNAWTVEYKNGSTWTAISNVQDLNCSVGRQTAVDQWPVSQASIRIWFPTGYATPIANLTIGTYIRFFAPGRSSTKPSWTGLVQNLTLEVGIPWNSGTSTGNGDFLVIDCEGALGATGRINEITMTTNNVAPTTVADLVRNAIANDANAAVYVDPTSTGADTYWAPDGNRYRTAPITALNETAIYSLMRLCDGVARQSSWGVVPPSATNVHDPFTVVGPIASIPSVLSVAFSDTTNNATNRIYDDITFDGLADLYYTKADLSTDNLGLGTTETISADLGQVPYRTFSSQILPTSASAPIASYRTNLAVYYANVFSPADISVSSISATTNGQHTQNLDTLGVTDLELGYLPLYVVPVTLRGTTFYCQIEGVQVTADTNQARFTYYVTPTDTTAWFTLDSSTFGVLDQNRLGIY